MSDTYDQQHNVLRLVELGTALGLVHVLTGPDHLSAMATLSSNKSKYEAFGYGIRWGIGHSMGLIVVTVVLLLITTSEQDVAMSPIVQKSFEFFVGIFMILLGTYGIVAIYIRRNNKRQVQDSQLCDCNEDEGDSQDEENQETQDLIEKQQQNILASNSNTFDIIVIDHGHSSHNHYKHLLQSEVDYHQVPSVVQKCLSKAQMPRTMALGIGIIHGLAGPGGILGVIPAIQLHNLVLGSLYLGTFCATSILIMGFFAGFYGSFTSYLSKVCNCEDCLDIFSAALSVLVGCLWCTLILTGQMDDVFPER